MVKMSFKFGRSIPRSAGRTTPLVWTSCGQDEFKFGRSTLVHTCGNESCGWLAVLTSQYWHLVVKMSSNLADSTPRYAGRATSPSKDIQWSRWVQIWQIYPYICWQIHPHGTDISCSKWFQIWQIYPLVLTSHSQDEFKYGKSTHRSAGRSTPLVLTSLVVKMSSNLADLPLDLL